MRESITERLNEEEEAEINLTPMLDVVFIMLIFFIVTAVFVKDPGVEITRPTAASAFTPEKGSIFIAVTAGNEIWVDKRSVAQRVSEPQLKGCIRKIPKAESSLPPMLKPQMNS